MSAKRPEAGAGLSRRPYLLRAMHEWIIDSGHTPHVIVDAMRAGVEVPSAYIKDGKIVLNLSTTATQRLQLSNDAIDFDARFAGIVHRVHVPIEAVLGVYARETGEGMVFSDSEREPTPSEPTPTPDKPPPGGERRPRLTVVK
jgi:stringent starvation protein B